MRPMARKAGKAKTRKSVAKRYKITGSGKIKRMKPGKRHILTKKSRKRKRNLGKSTLVDKSMEKTIKENMPFS